MNSRVYPYKTPLGLMVLIIFSAIVVETVLFYIAKTNTRPWEIYGFPFSPSRARDIFWDAAIVGLAFFAIVIPYCLYSHFTGKIQLSTDRVIAPKGELSLGKIKIPYSSIKLLKITTTVIQSPASGERKVRALNIFHAGGQTPINEALLTSPAVLEEIHAHLLASMNPHAQQLTGNVNPQAWQALR